MWLYLTDNSPETGGPGTVFVDGYEGGKRDRTIRIDNEGRRARVRHRKELKHACAGACACACACASACACACACAACACACACVVPVHTYFFLHLCLCLPVVCVNQPSLSHYSWNISFSRN